MTNEQIWNSDATVAETLGVIVPHWIDQDICISTVASIVQGGCNSGAYMPAVVYYRANKTMAEFGDDVLDYIENYFGELPAVPKNESWSGLACFYLSFAVELWAGDMLARLEGESE